MKKGKNRAACVALKESRETEAPKSSVSPPPGLPPWAIAYCVVRDEESNGVLAYSFLVTTLPMSLTSVLLQAFTNARLKCSSNRLTVNQAYSYVMFLWGRLACPIAHDRRLPQKGKIYIQLLGIRQWREIPREKDLHRCNWHNWIRARGQVSKH